jgi:hypothetical protein
MIRLTGPRTVEPGSNVCITATNVGAGFSAIAKSSDSTVKIKISIDPQSHTASVCFTAPASGVAVTIHVTDSSGAKGINHTTISN